MKVSDIDIGQVVKSIQGRDKGKFFIVIERIDNDYLLLVDGKIRKMDKPKKKKVKHLVKLNMQSEEVKDRVLNNKKMNNAFIRRELERLEVNV